MNPTSLTSSPSVLVQPFTFAAFYNAQKFNSDISSWDISKVTTLYNSKSLHPLFFLFVSVTNESTLFLTSRPSVLVQPFTFAAFYNALLVQLKAQARPTMEIL